MNPLPPVGNTFPDLTKKTHIAILPESVEDDNNPEVINTQHWFEMDDQTFINHLKKIKEQERILIMNELTTLKNRVQELWNLSSQYR